MKFLFFTALFTASFSLSAQLVYDTAYFDILEVNQLLATNDGGSIAIIVSSDSLATFNQLRKFDNTGNQEWYSEAFTALADYNLIELDSGYCFLRWRNDSVIIQFVNLLGDFTSHQFIDSEPLFSLWELTITPDKEFRILSPAGKYYKLDDTGFLYDVSSPFPSFTNLVYHKGLDNGRFAAIYKSPPYLLDSLAVIGTDGSVLWKKDAPAWSFDNYSYAASVPGSDEILLRPTDERVLHYDSSGTLLNSWLMFSQRLIAAKDFFYTLAYFRQYAISDDIPELRKYNYTGDLLFTYRDSSQTRQGMYHGDIGDGFLITANDKLTSGNRPKFYRFDSTGVIALSTEEIAFATDIEIYPNPAQEHIFLKPEQGGALYLYNSNGRMVLTQRISAGELNRIQIDALPSGLYFLHIKSENMPITKSKLVIED